MSFYQQTIDKLRAYKKIELNNEKNLQFFLNKHSTKEGSWGHITVHSGVVEFVYLDGYGNELAHHRLTSASPSHTIAPASWHKIATLGANFDATLEFYCQPHRFLEKKYHLSSIHQDLWSIYNTYFQQNDKMRVLDVGCGTGRNTLYFALMGHEITGIDLNEKAIENIQHIATQEQLSNIETLVHDLNHPFPNKNQLFDFIYSTVTLQFLKSSSIEPLLTQLHSITSIGGMHFLVFPIKGKPYSYPESFTYLAEPNELYNFYQDQGWSILEYKEKPGQLHKLDDSGKPKQGVFGHLLAQKLF